MVNDADIHKVFDKAHKDMDQQQSKQTAKEADEKIAQLDKHIPSVFEAIWDDVKLITSLLHDYWHKKYIDISWSTIATISVALAYLVMPLDVVPDVIPVIGYIDDMIMIRIALQLVSIELERYRIYLLTQSLQKV